MKWKILAAAIILPALALTALPHQAEAKKCAVKAIKMSNNGAYLMVELSIAWPPNGRDERKGSLSDQTSRVFDLSKSDDPPSTVKTLKKGDEVWLEYDISNLSGSHHTNHKSCRKDDTQLIYDPDLGNTWNYYARGSTGNNNRCRVGKNVCITPYAQPK